MKQKYVPLSPAQIARAQHADLAAYLMRRGEKLRREGQSWRWAAHDSCIITGFMWYQNSTGKGGAAVSFLQHFFGMGFVQAVVTLAGSSPYAEPERMEQTWTRKRRKPKNTTPITFRLPKLAEDHRRAFAYLSQTRGIAPDIVMDLISEKRIAQDIHGNVLFLCYDKDDSVCAVHFRSTNTYIGSRYRGFAAGGDYAIGFSYAHPGADTLYVFEAPIDLLSYLTLHRHEPWHRKSYLALGGLSDIPLERFLLEHPGIQHIVFCLDNDADKPGNPGQSAARKYAQKYAQSYVTSIETPQGKDWNEVLLSLQSSEKDRKAIPEKANIKERSSENAKEARLPDVCHDGGCGFRSYSDRSAPVGIYADQRELSDGNLLLQARNDLQNARHQHGNVCQSAENAAPEGTCNEEGQKARGAADRVAHLPDACRLQAACPAAGHHVAARYGVSRLRRAYRALRAGRLGEKPPGAGKEIPLLHGHNQPSVRLAARTKPHRRRAGLRLARHQPFHDSHGTHTLSALQTHIHKSSAVLLEPP